MTVDLKALHEKTCGAYSFDRYRDWHSVLRLLIAQGYTEKQVEAIVLSKWARWAADEASDQGQKYGQITAKALVDFVAKQGMKEVEALTSEHFGE